MVGEDVQTAIETVIRERLGSRHVVNVLPAEDDEDDEVLWITVVVNDDAELDTDRVLGLVRHMLPPLVRLGESAFPIISIRS